MRWLSLLRLAQLLFEIAQSNCCDIQFLFCCAFRCQSLGSDRIIDDTSISHDRFGSVGTQDYCRRYPVRKKVVLD